MSEERINHWIGVLIQVAVEGGTGARMSPDIEREEKGKTPHKDKTFQAPQTPTRNVDHSER